jgi:uncharacterized protein (DUF488 family)
VSPVVTIGHSTRPVEEFVAMLREHGVELLIDVRRFPGSRRHPQYGSDALAATLAGEGIAYLHEPRLGGRRAARAEDGDAPSPNAGWRNPQFRAYADHMASPEFADALAGVLAEAEHRTVALMCAEAVPWRCHRGLIADVLVARGIPVVDALAPGRSEPHRIARHAVVHADGSVTYPPPQPDLFG